MIPSQNLIKRAFHMELYGSQNHTAIPDDIYDVLTQYFEGQLEDKDFERYYNSKNRWANSVQVARNKLVKEKLVLIPEQNKRGEWKLSDLGIISGRKLFVEAYGHDPWAKNEKTIISKYVLPLNSSSTEHQLPVLTFIEARQKLKIHIKYEKLRNRKLIKAKKTEGLKNNDALPCAICRFSFKEKYGDAQDLLKPTTLFLFLN